MKHAIVIFIPLLCCLLVACQYGKGNGYEPLAMDKQISADIQNTAYVKAYTDFLLTADFVESEYANFPVRGFHLVDLNFDRVPELLVFHDSCGSMGGYFRYYYFDGTGIKDISGSSSVYTQILADTANKKVYLLKEMYLLRGNENGTYGYLREIVSENGVPYINNILNLEVNQEINVEKYYSKDYHNENEFLMDNDLEPCFITQFYNGHQWIEITSSEYLQKKYVLLPEENEYKDLRDTNAEYLWSCEEVLGDEQYINRKITKEEIDILFAAWFESLEY